MHNFRGTTSTEIFSGARKFLRFVWLWSAVFMTCGSTVLENGMLRVTSWSKRNEVTIGMTKLYNEQHNLHYSPHITYL